MKDLNNKYLSQKIRKIIQCDPIYSLQTFRVMHYNTTNIFTYRLGI